MQKTYKIIGIGLAFIVGVLLTYFVMKNFQTTESKEQSHVIAYEIKKLNKMIVAEQNYSEIYTHNSKKYVPGLGDLFSSDKKVILLVNAKAQATYDMKQLKIDVDSTNKIIKIVHIPEVEIKIYPDIKFNDLDQGIFNTFTKDDLNGIKQRAEEHIKKTMDNTKLKQEAHQQLIENLSQLYILAHVYGWKVEDDTTYAKELQNKIKEIKD